MEETVCCNNSKMAFSDQLLNRTIQYFQEKHSHPISKETAELYLNSLTDLFTAYVKLLQEKPELIKDEESTKIKP